MEMLDMQPTKNAKRVKIKCKVLSGRAEIDLNHHLYELEYASEDKQGKIFVNFKDKSNGNELLIEYTFEQAFSEEGTKERTYDYSYCDEEIYLDDSEED